MLTEEALTGYNQIVPDGQINSSNPRTGHLIERLEDGRLDVPIVTLPIYETSYGTATSDEDRLF